MVYILNRCPTSKLSNKTPYEAFTGQKPNLKYIRKFGCLMFYHIPKEKRNKFDIKNQKGFMVGYTEYPSQYRIYDPDQRKVIVGGSVKFVEHKLYRDYAQCYKNVQPTDDLKYFDYYYPNEPHYKSKGKTISPIIQDDNSEKSITNEDSIEDNILDQNVEINYDEVPESFIPRDSLQMIPQVNVVLNDHGSKDKIPSTTNEALHHPGWQKAMRKEMDSIRKHNVYQLVEKPEGKRIVSLRWVFTKKHDGLLKARLVARGFTQNAGTDYTDTYSPVLNLETLKLLIVYAFRKGFYMKQLDVKTAFLYGDLEEEIYTSQAPGFEMGNNKVWKLRKSLYGLKQAPRCWNRRLHDFLTKEGYVRNKYQPCLYKHRSIQNTWLGVYVDDMVLVCYNETVLGNIRDIISEEFEIKDLGIPKRILGINISFSQHEVSFSQRDYIDQILKTFNMSDCNGVGTPMQSGLKLIRSEDKVLDKPYKNAIGMLNYLASRTRPDIAYTVNKLSQYSSCYNDKHWGAIKHLLRYLQRTKNYELKFDRRIKENAIIGYSDSDHAGDYDDRISTSGYAFMYSGGIISWKSKKQSRQALSSTEAEITAAELAVREAIWLNNLFAYMRNLPRDKMIIKIDNINAMHSLENPVINNATKHIEIDFFWMQRYIQEGQLVLLKVDTNDNIADGFTKALQKLKHESFLKLLKMI